MKIKALSNINHNGQTYKVDDVITLSDDAGQKLIDLNVAVLDESVDEPEVVEDDATPDEAASGVDIYDMSRAQLNAKAESLGMIAKDYATKNDIQAAIVLRMKETKELDQPVKGPEVVEDDATPEDQE